MKLLCRLFGHKIVTRSFYCQDGSVMFVNKCARWPCNYVETRHVSDEITRLVNSTFINIGKRIGELYSGPVSSSSGVHAQGGPRVP